MIPTSFFLQIKNENLYPLQLMPRAKTVESKRTRKAPPRKPAVLNSESETELSEQVSELSVSEKKKAPPKAKAEKKKATQKVSEDEEIFHECGQCGVEFPCPEGKFDKTGTKFKCSHPKLKEGGVSYYFCSKPCMTSCVDSKNESDGSSGDGGESSGYDTA